MRIKFDDCAVLSADFTTYVPLSWFGATCLAHPVVLSCLPSLKHLSREAQQGREEAPCFGEGNGNPRQYSCLENPMDKGDWQARVQRVTNSWTRLSDYTHKHTRTHTHTHALCSFLKTSRWQTSWPAYLWNLMGCSCD